MNINEALEIAAHPSAKTVTYARKHEALKLLGQAAGRLLVLRPGWPEADHGDGPLPGYPPATPPPGGWPQEGKATDDF